MQSSISSFNKKNKIDKYWSKLSGYFKLNNDVSLEVAAKVLKKFDQENSNPIQVFILIKNNDLTYLYTFQECLR